MGIRSQVGIAIRNEALPLSHEPNVFLAGADEKHVRPEGTLYVFHSANWDEMNKDVGDFMTHMRTLDEGQYLIVEACSEYPDPNGAPDGHWDDNPFDLRQEITVNLCYF